MAQKSNHEPGNPVNEKAAAPVSKQEPASKDSKSDDLAHKYLGDKSSILTSVFYGVLLLISAILAFVIRIAPKDGVFLNNGFIRLGENDPWYHWRNIDYLLHNYPHMMWFDPATTYPYGTNQAFAPLFDMMAATFIKILQFLTGNTSSDYAMTIFAYWPCLLAALCVIVIYFVAKKIFDSRAVGLASAFFVAIAPGQFLSRSIIGFSDHHVAEVLFSTIAVFFLIVALLKAKDKVITYADLKNKNFSALKPILPYAVLTGIFLGLYALVWEGALLFAFMIGVFVTIQMMANHMKGESTVFIAITGMIIFVINFIMVVVTPQIGEYKSLHMLALSAGFIAILAMAVLSYLLEKKNANRIYYPIILIVLGAAAAIAGSLISDSVRNAVFGVVGFFTRTGGALTIGEASPYFGTSIPPIAFTILIGIFLIVLPFLGTPYIKKDFSKAVYLIIWSVAFLILMMISGDGFIKLYGSFSVFGYLWLIALPLLTYKAVQDNKMERIFLVIWTMVILWALVQQNRFAYYFVVPIVILTVYLLYELAHYYKLDAAAAGWKKEILGKMNGNSNSTKPEAKPEPARAEKAESKTYRPDSKAAKQAAKSEAVRQPSKPKKKSTSQTAITGLAILCIALLVIVVPTAFLTVQYTYGTGGPNMPWINATTWMANNTPAPTLDPYGTYTQPFQDLDGDGKADRVSGSGIEFYENQVSTVPFNYPAGCYGIMSWWDYGHWIEVIGKRMPDSNPFQFGVGGRRGNVTDPMIPGSAPYFTAETEADATYYLEAIDPRDNMSGARYIVTDIEMASGMSKFYAMTAWTLDTDGYTVTVPTSEGNMTLIGSDRYFNSQVVQLHLFDAQHMKQYRMVYESEKESLNMQQQESYYKELYNFLHGTNISTQSTGYVKIFEYVKGANVTGTATPNSTVTISTMVQTNQGRNFMYSQTATADASGHYSFTVPYSTTGPISGQTNFVVKPTGQYSVTHDGTTSKVDVSEEAVLQGQTVQVV
ncbi:STT3 domain-containing protein [Methanolapillus millepedarum]|uniref:dolichyl-phosphooligosaccharide-protein glycotransferase n=1 Tax=Methanolapillus millepedarum TaxID=3028296 RepID=A0AA96V3N9_9EURY|nr:hypothetical protein MsAc7_15490 [Methanosarcinaceae archaeon Ac7]